MESHEDRSNPLDPVWFEAEHLHGEDFNPEHYITELSRYVPLETICSQLETHLNQLKLEVCQRGVDVRDVV